MGANGYTLVKGLQHHVSMSSSAIFIALDGVLLHKGRVVIMTTNHIERLDATLIRAGRVDRKVELPYADKDVATRLFCMIESM